MVIVLTAVDQILMRGIESGASAESILAEFMHSHPWVRGLCVQSLDTRSVPARASA